MPLTELHPRVLAYLGDAVYELHLRQRAIQLVSPQLETLHDFTTRRAKAEFQADLLEMLMPHLTETEQDWVRRGRNLPLGSRHRAGQAIYRQSTAFEALIGYLAQTDDARLQEIWDLIEPSLHPTS